jgi:hypothetical protein
LSYDHRGSDRHGKGRLDHVVSVIRKEDCEKIQQNQGIKLEGKYLAIWSLETLEFDIGHQALTMAVGFLPFLHHVFRS